MASIRRELINAVRHRVISLINHDDIDKEHELRKFLLINLLQMMKNQKK